MLRELCWLAVAGAIGTLGRYGLTGIVDKPERIEEFLPELDAMIGEGLVTLDKVRVITYRHETPK